MEERRIAPDCRMQELSIHIARLEEKLVASQTALSLAKEDINRRLEGMNELRAQILAERGQFTLRSEYEAKHEILGNAIRDLQKYQYMSMGALAVFQIVIAIVLKMTFY